VVPIGGVQEGSFLRKEPFERTLPVYSNSGSSIAAMGLIQNIPVADISVMDIYSLHDY
jgi:hypothetical protein